MLDDGSSFETDSRYVLWLVVGSQKKGRKGRGRIREGGGGGQEREVAERSERARRLTIFVKVAGDRAK